MTIKTTYHCIHCNQVAHEWDGFEEGIYINADASHVCPKSEDKEHDFQPDKKPEAK